MKLKKKINVNKILKSINIKIDKLMDKYWNSLANQGQARIHYSKSLGDL